jgi:hypothetical protein
VISADDEIARLRRLLWENGIDPDPEPALPPQFGPPTESEYQMQQLFRAATEGYAESIMEQITDMGFLSGEQDVPLKIKLPKSFQVLKGPKARGE